MTIIEFFDRLMFNARTIECADIVITLQFKLFNSMINETALWDDFLSEHPEIDLESSYGMYHFEMWEKKLEG